MAFVMDPLEGIDVRKDTTYVLMLEAQRRGHEVWYMGVGDLYAAGSEARARTRRVRLRHGEEPFYAVVDTGDVDLGFFDVVWMRKDPPFDLDYIYATYLLSLAAERGVRVINDPSGIRESNEKLYTLYFPEVTPPTLVTKEIGRIKEFLDGVGGEGVVKPLDAYGGEGVFYLNASDRNLNVILETVTRGGRVFVMVQRYIREVAQGDKRIILLDGEPLGAVLRVSSAGDFRCNFHSGGRPAPAEVDEHDRHICAVLAPRLRQDGLYFVGIDVIGGYVTEINTTSPTGVQEINRLSGLRLEERVIDFAESLCA